MAETLGPAGAAAPSASSRAHAPHGRGVEQGRTGEARVQGAESEPQQPSGAPVCRVPERAEAQPT
eukprot:1869799-Lingulodinium_polyedra.AAC.1